MEIQEIQIDDTVSHIALSGKLDVAGENAIGNLFTALTSTRRKPAVVDMTDVSFIASLGIRLLLSNARTLAKHGCKFVVVAPEGMVKSTLVSGGVESVIAIAATPEEGVQLATSD